MFLNFEPTVFHSYETYEDSQLIIYMKEISLHFTTLSFSYILIGCICNFTIVFINWIFFNFSAQVLYIKKHA